MRRRQPTLFDQMNFRIVFILNHLNYIKEHVRSLRAEEHDVVERVGRMGDQLHLISTSDYNMLKDICDRHQPRPQDRIRKSGMIDSKMMQSQSRGH